ncbi:complex I NDUFA9 subunit family protein [Halomonas chromatireducens]|uniref:NAD dependent epimerase/dehydratase family protein n=1 Tax=Halomonas chromatireducens TaxID=507626 RepID=A0A109UMX8_9GAMM|nr:complex I NDUFA9 subunit family protein [Halomonas chromatireducens]AMD02156.1 NAD dependent epimerase/dehydratase family protein [Halomonas chromatireducens]
MSFGCVTVFGGTGFLGSHVVRELADAGRTVRIAARRPALPDWAEPGDPLELVSVDIRSKADIAKALEGADSVVNAVSLYVESRSARFQTIHVEAAGQLAQLAHEAGIQRLVQLSGIGADPASRSAYVRARGRGETAVVTALPKAIILRPSVMFGPDDAFLSTLAGLTRLPVIPLFGHGETRLQPVHVVDVARAIGRLLGSDPPERRLFELGGPDIIRYREAVELVMRELSRERPLLPIPFPLWHLLALLASPLPNPPLTRDQVVLMAQDNVANDAIGSFDDLGILPRSLRDSLPLCLAVDAV